MDLNFFNPKSQKEQDFLINFVARQNTLNFFLQQLRLTVANQPARHILVIAPRGYGKTSLLRRISIAVRSEVEFSNRYIALTFREEQHNIISLDVFWRNCLVALQEAREDEGATAEEIDQLEALWEKYPPRSALKREEQDGEPAWQAFQAHCKQLGRRPILLIDNLDSLLAGLIDQHQWALRRILQRDDSPVLMAAASRYPESTNDGKAAFYAFFSIQTLSRLSDDEVMQCLRTLALHRGEKGKKVIDLLNNDPGRISALNTLAGGNPRTLNVLYSVLEADMSADILSQLSAMLDTFTGWYQARTEEIAPQSRAVFDALALNWNPIKAADLSLITGLDTPTVSSHLSKLEKTGYAEAVSLSTKGKGRNGYQVSERFYNIWYLMRNGPRRAQKEIKFLTAFLQSCFSVAERRTMAQNILGVNCVEPGYALALASSINLSRLRNQLLDHVQNSASVSSGGNEYVAFAKYLREQMPSRRKKSSEKRAEANIAFDKAYELYKDGKFNEAEVALREAIALDPKDATGYFNLGHLLHDHLNRYDEAEAAFRQAITLDPKDAMPLFALGDLLQNHLGRYEEAETAYRKGIVLEPKVAWPHNNLGNLLSEHLSRYGEAEVAYECAIALDSNDACPHLNLGNLLQDHLKRYDEAEAAYHKAIALEPDDAWQHFRLGTLFEDYFNRYDEAEVAYRKAIELDPNDAWQHFRLGTLFEDHFNRYDEAEVAYHKAIELYPNDAWQHFRLGQLLEDHLNRYDDAEIAYRRAIVLNPKVSWYHISLGKLLQIRFKRFDEAEFVYLQAVELEPKNINNAKIWTEIGNLRLDQKAEVRQAIEAYLNGLMIDKNDTVLNANYAYALALHKNEKVSAQTHAQLALDGDKFSSAGKYLLNALPKIDETNEITFQRMWRQIDLAVNCEDNTLWTDYLDDLQRLLWYVVVNDKGIWFKQKMEAAQYPVQFSPMYVAFKAALEGEDVLLQINPETRQPAQRIYDGLAHQLKIYPKSAKK
jgi:tetratricopeptide (TPR) repeat protein